MVYVIPDVSKEDELRQEAEQNNRTYNPVKDEDLTLEQITRLIKEKDLEVKSLFKQFCAATPDSEEHQSLRKKLSDCKS